MSRSRKELILGRVSDCVASLLYYDRKEDEELPRGEIESAVRAGEISLIEIERQFSERLREGMKVQ
jgi:hypothetical protein